MRKGAAMECCHGQAAMVCADNINSWWGVELLISLLKHTNEFILCENSMCDRCQHLGSMTNTAFAGNFK
jgi:hypothetical protein